MIYPAQNLDFEKCGQCMISSPTIVCEGRYYGLFFCNTNWATGNVAQYVLQKILYYLSAMCTPGLCLLQSLQDFIRAFISKLHIDL